MGQPPIPLLRGLQTPVRGADPCEDADLVVGGDPIESALGSAATPVALDGMAPGGSSPGRPPRRGRACLGFVGLARAAWRFCSADPFVCAAGTVMAGLSGTAMGWPEVLGAMLEICG
jgi:hypothetical protein